MSGQVPLAGSKARLAVAVLAWLAVAEPRACSPRRRPKVPLARSGAAELSLQSAPPPATATADGLAAAAPDAAGSGPSFLCGAASSSAVNGGRGHSGAGCSFQLSRPGDAGAPTPLVVNTEWAAVRTLPLGGRRIYAKRI
jgi:hypothetical protein